MNTRAFHALARAFVCCSVTLVTAVALAGDASQSSHDRAGKDPSFPTYRTSVLDVLGVRGIASAEEGVPITMRDGTVLNGTLIIPKGASADSKRPALLVQTPYLPQMELAIGKRVEAQLVRDGYVIVVVNDRGTEWSQGEYHWLRGAANDGYDSLEWVTHQRWSDGRVGTFGCSSSGEVQFALATMNPPGLKAFVAGGPTTGVGVIPGYADQGVFYTGGVPMWAWAWWYHGAGYYYHPKLPPGISQAERVALIHAFNPDSYYGLSSQMPWAGYLPSGKVLDAIGSPKTEFDRLMTMVPNDRRWKEYDFLRTGQSTRVPGMLVDSWYDIIEVYGMTRAFQYLAGNSPNQYMLVGPGPHCTEFGDAPPTKSVAARPIGNAQFDYAGMVVRWLNHWVKDGGRGALDMPRVQYYPLESGKWIQAQSWPPKSIPRRLYLSSNGHANSLAGDGLLLANPPSNYERADRFTDDPLHPVPSHGGACCSPSDIVQDQTPVEMRADVLVYTTPALKAPLDIAGYISATLYFSTSVPDTDLALKLVDVYPNGKAYNLLDTIERLRYRNGYGHVAMMKPGRVYKIVLREMVTASHFSPGHRLRIEIAGTNFPNYERNLNTGGRNYNESVARMAKDVIYHDAAHASYLQIPVVP